MTSILGLSAFYHDSAAALIKDGKIIAAAQAPPSAVGFIQMNLRNGFQIRFKHQLRSTL